MKDTHKKLSERDTFKANFRSSMERELDMYLDYTISTIDKEMPYEPFVSFIMDISVTQPKPQIFMYNGA